MADQGSGCGGVLIVVVLGLLLGGLFVADYDGSANGTGHDPAAIDLPRTVEHQRRLSMSDAGLNDVDATTVGLSPTGLSGDSQGVYGEAPGTAGLWVVDTGDNRNGVAGRWLAADPPKNTLTTHPQLSIGGSTTCYQDQHAGRAMCIWHDANFVLQVSGPTDPAGIERVLLRVYDGTEQ
ncbi:hypothetical protein [Kitasatospora viridis]|uniref:Uncharacterized protein n=1 Tax=Kitasatospora viridis TaxID=281105 RepID=A0A561SDP3_9ACTN|nr:hypothetical protein [Kitasatospora viridis]TWF72974.1 hypothetical protein FHX73_16125 [Kitasatospora viridis]